MNQKILEMIVAGGMLFGVATFTANDIYAQQKEHKTTKKVEVQKKECDTTTDKKACCDMKGNDIKNKEQSYVTTDKKACCDMKGNDIKNKEHSKIILYDKNPEVIKSVLPVYPQAISKKGIEGKVYVQVMIDTYGKPTNATIIRSSGSTPLDSSALVAVKQYQFKPAIVKDKAVESMVTIPVEYKLK